MKNLVLFLTNDCNLNCNYCYQFKNQRSMHFDTARKAVDFLALEGEPVCRIGFYGGEPLLEFNLMKEIIEYSSLKLKKKGIKPEYSVTTNGMLLDDEILSYLAEWNVAINLSVDGAKDVHEQAKGKSTFSRIEELFSMIKRYPECSVRTVSVITPENVGYLYGSIQFLLKKGIHDFIISPDTQQDWPTEGIQLFRQQYGKLRDLVEDYYNRTGKILIRGFELGTPRKTPYKCTPGKKSLAITPQGEVFGCTMLVPLWRKAKKNGFLNNFTDLQLGYIDDLLDPNLRKKMEVKRSNPKLFNQYYRYTRKKQCKDCEYLYDCHICPGVAMSYSKDPFLISESLCEISKIKISFPIREIPDSFKFNSRVVLSQITE